MVYFYICPGVTVPDRATTAPRPRHDRATHCRCSRWHGRVSGPTRRVSVGNVTFNCSDLFEFTLKTIMKPCLFWK